MPMTHAELGAQIKALHPSSYGHLEDERVGRAMEKRFPGVYDLKASKGLDANTVPETPRTLRIQLRQLAEGKRRAVFVPRGSKAKIRPKEYGAVLHRTPAGDVFFNPKKTNRMEIDAAFRDHTLNELLGDAELGYGAPAKEGLESPVTAVVARASDGTVAHGALTDQRNAGTARAVAERLKPPGGTVGMENPDDVVAERRGNRPGDMIFIIGGAGSGKSSSIPKDGPMKMLLDHARAVRELRLDDPSKDKSDVDAALRGGNNVVVAFIRRGVADSFFNGTGGSVDRHVETHAAARGLFETMREEYAGNPRVRFVVIDNSRGPGKAVPVSGPMPPDPPVDQVKANIAMELERRR